MMEKHQCNKTTRYGAYGPAIDNCWEGKDGRLWVANGEYASEVHYCPYCGFKAPTPAIERSEECND
jgi:hypothetical protein